LHYFANPIFQWILLLAVGLCLHGWWRRTLVAFTLLYMAVIGWSAAPSALLRSLEIKVAPAAFDESVQAIVVLGGGTIHYQRALDDYLIGPSFPRVLEAFRLAKRSETARVIFAGYTPPGMTGVFDPEGDSFRQLMTEFGIGPERITMEAESINTYENARNVSELLKQQGIQRFYLVTSAYHMPRAMDCFKRFGLEPLPRPTDYLVHQRPQVWHRYHAWMNLRFFTNWSHEFLGNLYYKYKY
jgi:uncharacterized SAM-binding protein YcdF (DUF218 family)